MKNVCCSCRKKWRKTSYGRRLLILLCFLIFFSYFSRWIDIGKLRRSLCLRAHTHTHPHAFSLRRPHCTLYNIYRVGRTFINTHLQIGMMSWIFLKAAFIDRAVKDFVGIHCVQMGWRANWFCFARHQMVFFWSNRNNSKFGEYLLSIITLSFPQHTHTGECEMRCAHLTEA